MNPNTPNIFAIDDRLGADEENIDYLYQNIELIYSDVSMGQRGFARNLDGLLAQLKDLGD